ncbi:hypothetical protein MKZ38_003111 [Zalerion maritima]|uniref:Uncharacterized protein n=1 Tax=Zalerion maritima TaxID=339359 RepID=A0AAD5WUN3_9PEZI|nr:hypothetical protein MKZ38_003111 [Zalerion maritima]
MSSQGYGQIGHGRYHGMTLRDATCSRGRFRRPRFSGTRAVCGDDHFPRVEDLSSDRDDQAVALEPRNILRVENPQGFDFSFGAPLSSANVLAKRPGTLPRAFKPYGMAENSTSRFNSAARSTSAIRLEQDGDMPQGRQHMAQRVISGPVANGESSSSRPATARSDSVTSIVDMYGQTCTPSASDVETSSAPIRPELSGPHPTDTFRRIATVDRARPSRVIIPRSPACMDVVEMARKVDARTRAQRLLREAIETGQVRNLNVELGTISQIGREVGAPHLNRFVDNDGQCRFRPGMEIGDDEDQDANVPAPPYSLRAPLGHRRPSSSPVAPETIHEEVAPRSVSSPVEASERFDSAFPSTAIVIPTLSTGSTRQASENYGTVRRNTGAADPNAVATIISEQPQDLFTAREPEVSGVFGGRSGPSLSTQAFNPVRINVPVKRGSTSSNGNSPTTATETKSFFSVSSERSKDSTKSFRGEFRRRLSSFREQFVGRAGAGATPSSVSSGASSPHRITIRSKVSRWAKGVGRVVSGKNGRHSS